MAFVRSLLSSAVFRGALRVPVNGRKLLGHGLTDNIGVPSPEMGFKKMVL